MMGSIENGDFKYAFFAGPSSRAVSDILNGAGGAWERFDSVGPPALNILTDNLAPEYRPLPAESDRCYGVAHDIALLDDPGLPES